MRVRRVSELGLTLTLATAMVLAAAGQDAALADAVRRGDKEAVSSSLKEHADVNTPQGDGATALHWAVYLNDPQTTDLLLRAGANVMARNDLGVTPLALAAQQGGADVIDLLLKAGAKPNDPANFGRASNTASCRCSSCNSEE